MQFLFGDPGVLVAPLHLAGRPGIARVLPPRGVGHIHRLFERHEVLRTDGLWSGRFQPAARTLSARGAAARAELLELVPELASAGPARSRRAPRPTLRAFEVRLAA